jgi:hypothetical protein
MNEPVELGNVLPKELFDEIGKELFNKGWRLSNKSAKGTKRFWTQYQVDNPIFIKAGEIVKDKIKEYTKENIKLVRIHCNGQTTGQDGAAHRDFVENNVWTVILFTAPRWDVRLGGGFNVINPELKKHQFYHYAPNWAVLIPSNWSHWGDPPNTYTDELRTSVAFSFTIEEQYDIIRKKAIESQPKE